MRQRYIPEPPGFFARGGIWVLGQVSVTVLGAMVPVWTGHNDFAPDTPGEWIGAVLTAVGLLFSLAGLASLGRSLSPFPRPLDTAALHERGLYALVRHPIYAGLIVGSVGWALWWHSAWGLMFCAGFVVFFDRKAAREEAWLREKFPGYDAYARRVRRLVPWIY
jgi:protein-S-isoprenylcysteine O-methyltransferase Ste14